MQNAQAGFEGTLYIGNNALTEAVDVTIPFSADLAEVSARGDAGWKDFIHGLKEWGVEFTAVYRNAPTAALNAIRTAYFAGTDLTVRAIDKDGEGIRGTVKVSNWGKEEPLNDKMSRSVSLKGRRAPTYINTQS